LTSRSCKKKWRPNPGRKPSQKTNRPGERDNRQQFPRDLSVGRKICGQRMPDSVEYPSTIPFHDDFARTRQSVGSILLSRATDAVPCESPNATFRPLARYCQMTPAEAGPVITNSIGMKLVHIPAGSFVMRSSEAEYGREPGCGCIPLPESLTRRGDSS
jgi:hypothetical protein